MSAIGLVALLVRDYDEALGYFVGTLGFALLEDTDLGGGKRWVRVAPGAGTGTALLLARAIDRAQGRRVGDQAGGRVFLFLHTDDCRRDHARLLARGVAFEEAPRDEPYGVVAVFRDLYGNRWDLIEPRPARPRPVPALDAAAGSVINGARGSRRGGALMGER